MWDLELTIAGHFRELNERQANMNNALSDKVQRLTVGIEHLVEEMQGVRTGKKEEAFARVGASDASPDLPTVSAESALIYTLSAADIGELLGFHSSQIGLLLSAGGLGWAGNGDYQELGRHKKRAQTKWWHRDLPAKLRDILDRNRPGQHGIANKAVLAIFRDWQSRGPQHNLIDASSDNSTSH